MDLEDLWCRWSARRKINEGPSNEDLDLTDQSCKTGVEFYTDPIFVQSCLMQRLGGWTFLETAEGIKSPEFCLPLLIGLDKPPSNHHVGKKKILSPRILSKSKLGGCSLMKQFSSQNILLRQMKSGSVNVCCIVLLHTCGPAKLDRPV